MQCNDAGRLVISLDAEKRIKMVCSFEVERHCAELKSSLVLKTERSFLKQDANIMRNHQFSRRLALKFNAKGNPEIIFQPQNKMQKARHKKEDAKRKTQKGRRKKEDTKRKTQKARRKNEDAKRKTQKARREKENANLIAFWLLTFTPVKYLL